MMFVRLLRKEYFIFGVIFLIFLFLRIPGLHLSYHQDEYKWPLYANPAVFQPGAVPHPPLTELIYRNIGHAIGYNNFRFIPFSFSVLNFFLIFFLAKIIFDKKTAYLTTLFFSLSFYSVLASLMVDTDGSIIPFFLLISAIGYFKLKENGFGLIKKNIIWYIVFCIGLVCGFLIKVSFILPIIAFGLDFCFERQIFSNKKNILIYTGYGLIICIGLVGVLLLSKLFFPFFNIDFSLTYWKHFAVFTGRGWMQTFIQFSKAIMYSSPLLLLSPLFIEKEYFKKIRFFIILSVVSSVFYLFLFDFSIGALDRYFEFLVVPFCLITAHVYSKNLFNKDNGEDNNIKKNEYKIKVIIFVITVLVFFTQFTSQFIPPLHPKSDWINRVMSLKWNFLFPFTGGSGPTGFYISFGFIAISWIVSIMLVILYLKNNNTKRIVLFGLFIIGLSYNLVFIEEYMYGKINGSPYVLFDKMKKIILNNKDIKSVIVYNDIGGYEIKEIGKYTRRMYATPQFEEEYKDLLSKFSGHILYIDIPKVGENTFYSKHFKTCKSIFTDKDINITANIYDCRKR